MREIGRGTECVVYAVDNRTVYKEYHSIHYAQAVFELQSIAAEQGLAPKAIRHEGIGYYSEMVITLENLECEERRKFYSGTPIRKALDAAIDKLFGGHWFDGHILNYGILSDGSLCVIDFGLVGFTYTDTGSKIIKKYEIEV